MGQDPVDSPWPDEGGTWRRAPPPFPTGPRPRRRRARLTWDEAYGLLLGLCAFAILSSHAAQGCPPWVVPLLTTIAGAGGVFVSAIDGGRSDWWARLVWALAAASIGLLGLVSARAANILEPPLLALQALAALIALRSLRRRAHPARAMGATATAAPAVLLALMLIGAAPAGGWAQDGLQALSMAMFGLVRAARRPRGLRIGGRRRDELQNDNP